MRRLKTTIDKAKYIGSLTLLLALAFTLEASPATAADMNALHARLSPMPVTFLTVNTITGEGRVNASLEGNILTLSGEFKGMSSKATSAHIHKGPKAQPGPVAFSLELSDLNDGSGRLNAQVSISEDLIDALHAEGLYIQIHSEDNPSGELRGWLLH
ncbi:MAG: CHRD domain-containing protein [Pseudohongiellaceae bacterium]|nr:CHRD domain-containing protein [Pseudohongiellaceae bacterium]